VSVEAEIAQTAISSCSNVLVPCALQEAVWLISSIAIIFASIIIPVVLWYEGQWREKRRATLDTIRDLATDSDFHKLSNRVYRHLKSEKEPESGEVSPYSDKEKGFSLRHDCGMIMNVFDTVCIQLQSKLLDEDILYNTSRVAFFSVENDVFPLLQKFSSDDNMNKNFPALYEICKRWKEREKDCIAATGKN